MVVSFINDDKDAVIASCILADSPRTGDLVILTVDGKDLTVRVIRCIHRIGNIIKEYDDQQRPDHRVEIWVEVL